MFKLKWITVLVVTFFFSSVFGQTKLGSEPVGKYFSGYNDLGFADQKLNVLSENRQKIPNVIFGAMIVPYRNEIESLIWVKSIRKFSGRYSSNPIWMFVPNKIENLSEAKRKKLYELGVELFPFPMEASAARFPLAAKPFAAAEAEKLALGKCKFLAWIDSDHMIINEPDEFILPVGKNLGYRPVHHINVGSIYTKPLNDYWALIYKDCKVPSENVFPMRSNIEDIDIRPYLNAGHLVVKPERGILKRWLDNFKKLYLQPAYLELYKKIPAYKLFFHQAVFSATVLSEMTRDEICEFSVKYNYPLNLYCGIPVKKRIKKLNDLVAPRYDNFGQAQHWIALMEIDEPLKSWIAEQFKLKGVDVLALFENKFGANNFLNRDVFEQYGWNVTIAGLRDSVPGCDFFSEPYKFPPLVPDVKFDQIVNMDYYQALAIMPVTSYQPDPFRELMDNEKAMNIIRYAVQKNISVSTICSGTRILAAADVIRGKKVLGHPRFREEYEKSGSIFLGKDFPPQIEGNILTASRDQYYNNLVVMALATMIEERGSRGPHKNVPAENFIISFPIQLEKDKTKWTRIIGGFGADGARSLIETEDGGFLLTGYTFSQATGDADILVAKTNSSGSMEWYRTFGGDGTEYGYGCTKVSDGYLITGYTTSFGAGSKDVYLIKLDFSGNETWSKNYGGKSWDVGMSSCESDNGYMICGFSHSFGKSEEDIYVVNIDKNGNEIWAKTYGGERFEIGNSIYRLEDGNFIIGATTGTFGGGNSDMYLVKIDAKGNELWTKSLGGQMNRILPKGSPTPTDWGFQLKPTSDGGFIMVGYTNAKAKDIMNALVVKTDKDGNFVWGQNLGNSSFYDYGWSIAENRNGEFIMCGASKSITQNNDIFLAKIKKSGNIIWQKTIGTKGSSDWGSAICITKDGRIIVTGHSNLTGLGSYDAFIMELEK